MPVTAQNVTSLMHPTVDSSSKRNDVNQVIEDLIADPMVPFGEQEGSLRFFSEKISDIESERAQIPLRTIETQRIRNDAIRRVFDPLPSTRLNGTLTVKAGIKSLLGAMPSSLAGDREPIQIAVDIEPPEQYEAERTNLIDESRQRGAIHSIFLISREATEIEEKVREIYRSREIVQRHRNDPDQEVKEYCVSQTDRATTIQSDIEHQLQRSFMQGSFVFRGDATAVESLDPDLAKAAREYLKGVAELVFDRYADAPFRADTSLAEKLLRLENLKAVTSETDPLELVQISGGAPRIDSENNSLLSIKGSSGTIRHGRWKTTDGYFRRSPIWLVKGHAEISSRRAVVSWGDPFEGVGLGGYDQWAARYRRP